MTALFHKHGSLLLAAALVLGTTGAGSAEPARFEFTQRQMGVAFTITLYAADERAANKGAEAAFARIAALNSKLSDYDPNSELSRLGDQPPAGPGVVVSDDLWHVLQAAQRLSKKTDGAFDVTVGPLSRLWRRARRQQVMPDAERLRTALKSVGYEHLILAAGQRVQLKKTGMRLDLGGIAKGYAADEALRVLAAHGVRQALVDGSGDVALGDPPPGEPGWVVGVAPLKADGPPSLRLVLSNCAVATSGDAWQHVEINGVRYSHIINPKTGLGLTDSAGVTVVAPTCIEADSLASAVSVLGPEQGIALIDCIEDAEAMVITATPDGDVEKHTSRGFDRLPRE